MPQKLGHFFSAPPDRRYFCISLIYLSHFATSLSPVSPAAHCRVARLYFAFSTIGVVAFAVTPIETLSILSWHGVILLWHQKTRASVSS